LDSAALLGVLTTNAVAVPPKPASLSDFQLELVLLLNILSSVRGVVRAELLDATTGQPLAGYSLNESVPLVGHNALQVPLQWSALPPSTTEVEPGSQTKLRVESTYTKIFSFELAWRPAPPPPPPPPVVDRDPVRSNGMLRKLTPECSTGTRTSYCKRHFSNTLQSLCTRRHSMSTSSTRHMAPTITRTPRCRGPTKQLAHVRASPSAMRTRSVQRGRTLKFPRRQTILSAAAFPQALAARTIRLASSVVQRQLDHAHLDSSRQLAGGECEAWGASGGWILGKKNSTEHCFCIRVELTVMELMPRYNKLHQLAEQSLSPQRFPDQSLPFPLRLLYHFEHPLCHGLPDQEVALGVVPEVESLGRGAVLPCLAAAPEVAGLLRDHVPTELRVAAGVGGVELKNSRK